MRFFGTASHSCPFAHCHRSFFSTPRYALDRHLPPLLAAILSISPKLYFRKGGLALVFQQAGHPVFTIVRLLMLVCQLCPFGQRHQTFLLVRGVKSEGLRPAFFS